MTFRNISLFGLVIAGLCVVSPASAIDPATLARSGGNGLASCASCHGANGQGQSNFPKLAGLDAGYLTRQLNEFASGQRASPVMAPIAKKLAVADRTAMATYYSKLPDIQQAAPVANNALGQKIALHGAWSKNVPACVQCHGPGGRGVGSTFPAIAGQTAGYIGSQLRAFASGQRANDPLQLMRSPAKNLTAAEIEAVAAYFAAQPAKAPSGGAK